MATFQSLSDEILLLEVQRFIPHAALLKIATVCMSLNRCSTPEIYRYVHYHEPWNLISSNRMGRYAQVYGWYADKSRPNTKIHSLQLFLRTISSSEELRRHVFGASFYCNAVDEDEITAKVVRVLSGSAHFPPIHLAPYGPLDASTIMPVLNTVTSLEIRFDHLQPALESESIPMDTCYDVFCLPNLRSLAIIHVRSWTPQSSKETSSNTEKSMSRVKTSKVTCLSFFATIPPGPDFDQILSWPNALKSLHYELSTDDHHSFGLDSPTLSPVDFSTALLSQMTSLEEPVIYGDCQGDNKGYMPAEVFDLRLFPNIRVAGLGLGFLMVSKLDAECADGVVGDLK
ncbi:hypothetical protein ONS95_012926 [Cadophora gregata]|uniref:uncharacterized protein n=1 Tax=Cadophora gregata TaxID=51156 RepID=UPI0026DB691C|nr:uncharacterized protein ONS95_012926 [Cadophora gregata]KAK0101090.1 hypothetical protein ONS96_006317 [Cadophora gregata f. sp. sojae]KAK0115879.1 hypothetical protein ONS95_012926 [Cadophora gregata]